MALSFSIFNKFKALDGVTVPIRKMGKNVGKFGKEAVAAFKRADAASSRFGKNLRKTGRDISTKITLPVVAAMGLAVKASLDFENAFTGVIKTVKATDEELRILEKELINISREIPVTTTEIFNIAEAAGQLSIKTKDIKAFTRVIADLKATTNLEDPAADLARFSNIAGVSADDIERLGSTIVDLGNNAATTEAEIVEMSLRLAAAGRIVGLSASETLGLSAALSSVGINAEAGGTAFSQVMIKINKEIGTGSDKMKGFAKVSGKTVKQFEKMWKEDTSNALLVFTEGLKKAQDGGANVNVILDELGFTGIRISDALLRASSSGNLFRKTIEIGNRAWTENNALAKEAALRYETNTSKLIILSNKIKIMASTFGDIIIPALIKIADFLAPIIEKFEALSPKTKLIIVVVGLLVAAIGPLLIAFGFLASAITTLIALGLPIIATIVAITAAVIAVGFAALQVIRNWDQLKDAFTDVEFMKMMLKDFADWWVGLYAKAVDKVISKITGMADSVKKKFVQFKQDVSEFFGFGNDEEETPSGAPSPARTPIGPNAGFFDTLRKETIERSRVDVNLNGVPPGTEITRTGKATGFNLNMGFSGAL